MTRLLIVDDSATARLALRRALASDPTLEVVGEAQCGASAVEQVLKLRPDLVTMDVQLGRDDGVEVARRIMTLAPTPILVVTALDPPTARLPFRTVEAGALGIVAKPPAPGHPSYEHATERLRRLVRTLAAVPVVTRRRPSQRAPERTIEAPRALAPPSTPSSTSIIAIGASTGGPPALFDLLARIPKPFPLPILIAQHIEPGFVAGMGDWLCSAGHRVGCLATATTLTAGRIYLPPDGVHLGLLSATVGGAVHAGNAPYWPSIDTLFSSVARHAGPTAVGILLGGMGRDGTQGLLELRLAGGRTFAQEPSTCVVDAMPRAAIDAGAVTETHTPVALAAALTHIAQQVTRRTAAA